MPCTCHGPKGEVVSGKVTPDDPCTVCASKHVNLAASAWNEFTYEWDNRLFAAGHLRLAAEHLRKNHRHLALKARDIAVAIEMVRDKNMSDIAARIKDLQASVRTAFELEHPDVVQRFHQLTQLHLDRHPEKEFLHVHLPDEPCPGLVPNPAHPFLHLITGAYLALAWNGTV